MYKKLLNYIKNLLKNLLNYIKKSPKMLIFSVALGYIIFKKMVENFEEETADPYCESGVKSGSMCCHGDCKDADGNPKCGGPGCANLMNGGGAGGNCCFGTIKAGERLCSEVGPPCKSWVKKSEEVIKAEADAIVKAEADAAKAEADAEAAKAEAAKAEAEKAEAAKVEAESWCAIL